MFVMRMQFNEQIIKTESFENLYINGKKQGFSFDIQLAYYRGHYLSDIDLLEVLIDGEKIPDEAVTFELKGKELSLYKLKYAVTEFWSQVEPAKLHVLKPGGLAGEHDIELKLVLRIPYMQIGPEHDFMPLDSGEKVSVSFEGE
ncbi:C-glycoside deglycosidase beta subunit domain-containing protein [Enterococcus sp. DIV0756]|uniref:C-glycoside deglycosidase beta subunit domain-containing protein n=1 Tax=Enterococcus sp. DIV0756 TaxID=2774636 RepID=UPI003F209B76